MEIEKELKRILGLLGDKMDECEENDDAGVFEGLEIAYDLIEKRLMELKKNKPKVEEKINFWDIKKSIHEKNKENANCITDFLGGNNG